MAIVLDSGRYPLAPAHVVFDKVAAERPNAVAVVCGDERLAYADLRQRGDALASRLLCCEEEAPARIGLYSTRSAEAIVGFLGILKAGHVCVPLDPGWPLIRRTAVVADAGIRTVVTGSTVASPVADASIPLGLVTIPDRRDEKSTRLLDTVEWSDPAYVSYTSGTTGRPKGVIFNHRHLCHAMPRLAADDVCALNTSLSFGACLTRLWPTLLQGATLVVIPEEDLSGGAFLKTIAREGVTTVGLVPSALRQLLLWIERKPSLARSLREVTVGGAPLSRELVERFAAALPETVLLYGYGGSEMGSVTLSAVTPQDFDPHCVGAPVPDTHVFVLDERQRRVPTGETGHVFVASPHISLGYVSQPELTGERYVPNPWARETDCPTLFRTGDRGRLRRDGRLEWLGRDDHLVKIRGSRVELHEVEAVLLDHASVEEVAVSTATIGGETHLIAYVTPSGQCSGSTLRRHVALRLPNYMVPSGFVMLDNLPLTSTGKVDRAALPTPRELRSLESVFVEPATELERLVARTWRDVLRLDAVGVDDHFMDLGGDSVFATQAMVATLDRLGIDTAPFSLFDYPTPRAYAAALEALLAANASMKHSNG